MRDFTDDLKELRRRLGEAEGYLKIGASRARLTELEFEVSRPDLWDDQDLAKKINAEYANVKGDIDTFDQLSGDLDDVELLHEMAREVDDESQETDIQAAIDSIGSRLRQLDLRSLFTGDHDEADCIVQINAKDGGVDAQDFAATRRPSSPPSCCACTRAGPSSADSTSRSTSAATVQRPAS